MDGQPRVAVVRNPNSGAAPDAAVEVIRRGRERRVDVGAVNGHLFLNNVSIGNYPRMVDQRDALERRGRSHVVASAVAVARTWWHLAQTDDIGVAIDGEIVELHAPLQFAIRRRALRVLSAVDSI